MLEGPVLTAGANTANSEKVEKRREVKKKKRMKIKIEPEGEQYGVNKWEKSNWVNGDTNRRIGL